MMTAMEAGAMVVVIALVLAILIYRWQKGPVQEDQPMPEIERGFLAFYLLALAVVLVYVVLKVFSVQFPDAQTTQPLEPPQLPPRAAGTPEIVQVVPSALSLEMGVVDVRIYGYDFLPPPAALTAQVNGASRPARRINDQFVVVSLPASDTATPGTLSLQLQAGTANLQRSIPVRALTGTLELRDWKFEITREGQLLLLVVTAGALGSYIHAIRSLTDYIGNRVLVASWFWFYVTKPFVGIAMALVFYAALRGGFVAGSTADVKSVNPFGVFALAGLVGMFSDKASVKLGEIFEALFRTAEQRKDPLTGSGSQTAGAPKIEITTSALADGKVGSAYPPQTLAVKGGAPPHKWSALDLPAGLTLAEATGIIAGTPSTAGKKDVKITVTDKADAKVTKTVPITITA